MNKKQSFLQFLKFTLFSISAGIIEIGVFTLLNELLVVDYWPAYLTGLIASIVWNFTFNRKFTFKSASNVPIAMLKVFAFYLVFTPVSTILGDIWENSGGNEYLVLGVTMVANFVLEFLYCKFFVYRKEELARKNAEKTE